MQVISHTLQPVPEALKGLFEAAHDCLLLERLHFVDDEPIALGRSHLPAELASVVWTDVEYQPIYSILTDTARPSPAVTWPFVRKPPDASLASTLHVKRGAARCW